MQDKTALAIVIIALLAVVGILLWIPVEDQPVSGIGQAALPRKCLTTQSCLVGWKGGGSPPNGVQPGLATCQKIECVGAQPNSVPRVYGTCQVVPSGGMGGCCGYYGSGEKPRYACDGLSCSKNPCPTPG